METKYRENENFGHWFPDDQPFEANTFLLEQMAQLDRSLRDYKKVNEPSDNWREQGVYGKFDQDAFALQVNP